MVNTIDMQGLRHLNLFMKVTRIPTRHVFSYNDTLMFCVPASRISQALGRNNENLKKMSDILKKRVRVLPMPSGPEDIEKFIKLIIAPLEFNSLEVNPEEVIVTAGPQSKAALLGRNKRRLLEMQTVIKDFFGLGYRVI